MFEINALYVNRLKGCVDSQGIDFSINRLAFRCNITRQQASKILKGVSLPRVDTALLICSYISELFGFEVEVSDMWILKR